MRTKIQKSLFAPAVSANIKKARRLLAPSRLEGYMKMIEDRRSKTAAGLVRIRRVVSFCKFTQKSPAMGFLVDVDNHRPYLQIECYLDGIEVRPWKGRKWWLSFHMTDQEIIGTCFSAILMAVEHEVRQNFRYKGQPIYNTYIDPEALVEICKQKRMQRRAKRKRKPTPLEKA